MVRHLVENGANLEKANDWDNTPLIHAVCDDHVDVVRYLLEKGANANKVEKGYCCTYLHYAASSGVAHGASLDVMNNEDELPIDIAKTEEIRQAILDEIQRRRDQQPRKRCVAQDQHPKAAVSASLQQVDE